jgi:hypothetical protein
MQEARFPGHNQANADFMTQATAKVDFLCGMKYHEMYQHSTIGRFYSDI